MARLPTVAGDNDAWGTVLNDFLSVSHNADGTLKYSAAGYFNVKDTAYGAAGNGIADDGPAIRAARDAAVAAGGGTVYFPKGTYKVTTGDLEAKSNVTYQGEGARSVITIGRTGPLISLVAGISNFTVRDLKLVGNWTTYTNDLTNAIGTTTTGVAAGCSNIQIENVDIDQWYGGGIVILGASGSHVDGVLIDKCRISNIGQWGILCQDYVDNCIITRNRTTQIGIYRTLSGGAPGITAGRNSVDVVIEDNIIDGAGGLGVSAHGISLDTCLGRGVVGNNTIKNCTGYGIENGWSIGSTITGNTITAGTRAGIAVSGSTTFAAANSTISGNTIDGGSAQGIYVFIASRTAGTFQTNLTITGNTVRTSGQSGIEAAYLKHSTVSGNTVTGAVKSGIYLDMTDSETVLVTDNNIQGCNTSADLSHGGLRVLMVTAASSKKIRVHDNYLAGSGVADWYPTENLTLNKYRFIPGDTTPTVAGQNVFACNNTGSTSITKFEDGYDGQVIYIEMDVNTTIVHSASTTDPDVPKCIGATNITGAAGKIVSFVKIPSATGIGWKQISTSASEYGG